MQRTEKTFPPQITGLPDSSAMRPETLQGLPVRTLLLVRVEDCLQLHGDRGKVCVNHRPLLEGR